MTHTLKQSKRARKYGLGSAAIVLATVASLGTAGSAKAEEAKKLEQLPDPAKKIRYTWTGDWEARKYLNELHEFLQSYLGDLEKQAKEPGPQGPKGEKGEKGDKG